MGLCGVVTQLTQVVRSSAWKGKIGHPRGNRHVEFDYISLDLSPGEKRAWAVSWNWGTLALAL